MRDAYEEGLDLFAENSGWGGIHFNSRGYAPGDRGLLFASFGFQDLSMGGETPPAEGEKSSSPTAIGLEQAADPVSSGPATITARIDDQFWMYVNGELVLSGTNWLQVQSVIVDLMPGDVIAIRAIDWGGPGAAFVDIRLADGTKLGTSDDWLVSDTATGDWTSQTYDDSAWINATEHGPVNTAPWTQLGPDGALPQDGVGQWIWTDDLEADNQVYFRFTVPGEVEPPVNVAPIRANPIPDTTAYVDGTFTYTVPVETFTDANGDALTYTATLADGNPLPSWLVFNPATRTFTGNPDSGDIGTVSVRVTATDPGGLAADDVFDIETRTAPASQDATITARIDDQFWLYVNGELVMSGNSWTQIQSVVTELGAGDVIAIRALDWGGPGAAFVDIRLADGTVIGTSDDWKIFEGTPTGDWKAQSYDDSAWLNATEYGPVNTAPWLPTGSGTQLPTDSPGQWIWSDDNEADNQVYFRFTIGGDVGQSLNSPPEVETPLPNQATEVDEPFSFTVPLSTFSDPDGDVLTYSATLENGDPLPSWLSFNPATRTFTGTPDAGDYGMYYVRVTATDPNGASVSDVFDLNVYDEQISQEATITARIDDQFWLYVNGELVMSANTWLDVETAVVDLKPGDVIAIRAIDWGGPGAAFVDIRLADGTLLGTSSDWKVAQVVSGDWTSQSYDDSAWINATEHGPVNTAPWTQLGPDGPLPQDSVGQWIWTSDIYGDDAVYLRFTIPGELPTFNEPPVGVTDEYTLDEDTQLSDNVLDNDTDEDGDTLTAELVTDVSNGTLQLNSDGSFTYTPNANFNGTDSFTYRPFDGEEYGNEVTVTLTVNPVNDAPTAVADSYTVAEDSGQTLLAVLDNDSDVDGDTISIGVGTQPANGFVTSDGTNLYYTPNANFFGTDTFQYTAFDGTSYSDPVTVTVTVTPVNDDPVAVNDEIFVSNEVTLTNFIIDVLANDTDVDGDTLQIDALDVDIDFSNWNYVGPGQGNSVGVGYDFISLDAVAGSTGYITITYPISDGNGGTDVGTAIITFGAVSPVAEDDGFSVDEDNQLTGNVLADNGNGADSDPNGDALTVSVETGPTNGSLTLNPDGTFTYTPNADFNGTDSFTYTASDGTNTSDPATVTITVNPVNDAPVGNADIYSLFEDSLGSAPPPGVLANDTDVDGDTLTAVLVDGPSNGVIGFNSDGSFTYQGNPDFFGVDTFTYRANDGTTDGNITTVTLIVVNTNDDPDAVDDTFDVTTGDGVYNVLTNDTDVDGDSLTVTGITIVPGSLNVIASWNPSGELRLFKNSSFDPLDPGTVGTVTVEYDISDGNGGTDTATATFNINIPLPTATLVISDVSILEGDSGLTMAEFTVTLDGEADGPFFASFGLSEGTATGGSNGQGDYLNTISFNANFTGADGQSFTFQAPIFGDTEVEDDETFFVSVVGIGGTATNVVAGDPGVITILNDDTPNTPPVAVADEYTVAEDSGQTQFAVLDNDSDADGDTLQIGVGTQPANGFVTSDGVNLYYTPIADFHGTDTFTYNAFDGTSYSDFVTVTVTVTPVNDDPLAVSDIFNITSTGDFSFNVLLNDTDVDGDTLTTPVILYVSGDLSGLSFINAGNGTIDVFGVAEGVQATIIFSYTLSDGNGGTDTGTVTINIDTPLVNSDPVAVDDALTGQVPTAEFLVNTVAISNQLFPSIVGLEGGGFVITWQSTDGVDDSSGAGVRGRIFDAEGEPLGMDFLVNTRTSNTQGLPEVTSLDGGGFLIVWQSNDQQDDAFSFGIKAQVYNSDGTPNGGEFLVNSETGNDQTTPAAAALDGGGFVITWQSNDGQQDADSYGIKAQIFNTDGTPNGTEFLVNNEAASGQVLPDVDALDGGGFVVTWYSLDGQQDTSLGGIKARIFNADGSPNGTEILVNTQTNDDQYEPAVTALVGGGFVITWRSADGAGDPSETGIKAQIFGPDGEPSGGEFLVNAQTTNNQNQPSITALNDGGFVITWASDDGVDDSSGVGVKARIYNADGTPRGGEILVNTSTSGSQNLSNVAALEGGGFAVTWVTGDATQDGFGTAIKAQIFDADGNRVVQSPILTDEDTPATIDTADLLANDTDPDSDTLTVTSVDATSANGAALTLNVDGTITYDPTGSATIGALDDGETLTDTFTYTISDGNGGEDTATVSLVVAGVGSGNTAPTATGDSITVDEDAAPFVYDVLGNDTDGENDGLTLVSAVGTPGAFTSIQINPDDTLTVTLAPDYNGTAEITYTLSDGEFEVNGTAEVIVNPVAAPASITFGTTFGNAQEAPTTPAPFDGATDQDIWSWAFDFGTDGDFAVDPAFLHTHTGGVCGCGSRAVEEEPIDKEGLLKDADVFDSPLAGFNSTTALTVDETTDAAESTATTYSMVLGDTFTGTIESGTDEDWIAIELTAGQVIQINHDGDPTNGTALADPYLRLRDASGAVVALDDDGGPGLNSQINYTVAATGTYYIEADAFSSYTGDYVITTQLNGTVPPGPPIETAPISSNPLLQAIDWGGSRVYDADPNTTTTEIVVYLSSAGDQILDDGVLRTSSGFNIGGVDYIPYVIQVFELIENYIDVDFIITTDPADQHTATFEIGTYDIPGGTIGYFNPPTEQFGLEAGNGWFDLPSMTELGMQVGGWMFGVILHEIGHGLGLAHPHDAGGGSPNLPGVSNSGNRGSNNLNQWVNTIMSYITDWDLGLTPPDDGPWYQSTFAPLDIAVLQGKYGANPTHNNTDTTYELGQYTYHYTVWDTGGTDTIDASGATNSTVINLIDAPLMNIRAGLGGVSAINGQYGGFNIANGAIIENAVGSDFLDVIYANAVANVMTGNGGNDIFLFDLAYNLNMLNGDTITDMQIGDAIYIVLPAGATNSNFIGFAPFSATGDLEMRYTIGTDQTLFEIDIDGDGIADGTMTMETGGFQLVATTPATGVLGLFAADIKAFEDNFGLGLIGLPIEVAATETGEDVTLTVITGLPTGSVLSAGTDTNGDGTVWTFVGAPPEDLWMELPDGYADGDFTLTVTATTQDGSDTETSVATQTVVVPPPSPPPFETSFTFSPKTSEPVVDNGAPSSNGFVDLNGSDSNPQTDAIGRQILSSEKEGSYDAMIGKAELVDDSAWQLERFQDGYVVLHEDDAWQFDNFMDGHLAWQGGAMRYPELVEFGFEDAFPTGFGQGVAGEIVARAEWDFASVITPNVSQPVTDDWGFEKLWTSDDFWGDTIA